MKKQTTFFNDSYDGDRWTYGCQYRPPTMYQIPSGWIVGSVKKSDTFRHGTVDYPRQLSHQEIESFELVEVSGPPEPDPEPVEFSSEARYYRLRYIQSRPHLGSFDAVIIDQGLIYPALVRRERRIIPAAFKDGRLSSLAQTVEYAEQIPGAVPTRLGSSRDIGHMTMAEYPGNLLIVSLPGAVKFGDLEPGTAFTPPPLWNSSDTKAAEIAVKLDPEMLANNWLVDCGGCGEDRELNAIETNSGDLLHICDGEKVLTIPAPRLRPYAVDYIIDGGPGGGTVLVGAYSTKSAETFGAETAAAERKLRPDQITVTATIEDPIE